MSQSHIRVQKLEPVPQRKIWLEILFGIVFLVVAGGILVYILSRPPIDTEHDTAPGKIIEYRIEELPGQPSSFGGSVNFRVQARVQYSQKGQLQERWMPASGWERNRDYLQLQINEHPKGCQVYWPPQHPENPKCRFE